MKGGLPVLNPLEFLRHLRHLRHLYLAPCAACEDTLLGTYAPLQGGTPLFDRSITIGPSLFLPDRGGVWGDRQPNHRDGGGLDPTLRGMVGLYTCMGSLLASIGQLQQDF